VLQPKSETMETFDDDAAFDSNDDMQGSYRNKATDGDSDSAVDSDIDTTNEQDEPSQGRLFMLPGYLHDSSNLISTSEDGESEIDGSNLEQDSAPDLSSNGSSRSCAEIPPENASSENLPVASMVANTLDDETINGVLITNQSDPRPRHLLVKSVILVGILLVVIIAPTLTFQLRSKESTPKPPLPDETLQANQTNGTYFSDVLKEILIPISGEESLLDPTSPQHDAWGRISGFEKFILANPEEADTLVQLYVLTVLLSSFSSEFVPFAMDSSYYVLGLECQLTLCNFDGKVTHLFYEDQESTPMGGGTIPAEISFLRHLKMLAIGRNSLSGTIPTELGLLKDLHTLDVSGNRLTGTIPTELGQMQQLRYIYLGSNDLSGAVPSEIGDLNLHYVNLSENALHGTIPSLLSNSTNLAGFDIHANDFHGDVNFMCNKEYENINFTSVTPGIGFLEVTYSYVGFAGIKVDCDNQDDGVQCDCCTCA